ncbi:helix-turn-helix domain-containing protein [Aidingimonas halophila]|uniref:Helix-turn-helix n=1 Tax=Aidingimonas halophila TaxID=574349 RepID=A0A1H3ERT6_9GAMM|nr:helix-turn-helix transcriptional regulator [Aidingimonas halophila]GHC31610.1 hypothetical protein GCM10008094_25220 [Aidingimonas halophila]SDX81462.1 Helix-turn-helix [Aidingimonas halophila]
MVYQSGKSHAKGVQAWDVDGFCERLRRAMAGRSAYALERDTGIAQSLIRKYLSGSSLPGADKLVVLASALGVSVGWLAIGEGDSGSVIEGVQETSPSLHSSPSEGGGRDPRRHAGVETESVPTIVYARIMEPLMKLTRTESQREWVLQRAIDVLRVLTDGRSELMEVLSQAELEKTVALVVAVHSHRGDE